jgi:hypothetical protein
MLTPAGSVLAVKNIITTTPDPHIEVCSFIFPSPPSPSPVFLIPALQTDLKDAKVNLRG